MKRVFSNHEVFHIWASRSQLEGRNSGNNIRFRGDKLYSYSTVIAEFHPEHNVVVMHENNFSNTTTRHKSLARSAIPSSWRVIVSPEMNSHNGARRAWEAQFTNTLEWLERHPRRKVRLGRELASIEYRYNAYREAFGLDWSDLDAGALKERMAQDRREYELRVAEAAATAELIRKQRALEQAEKLALWRTHELVGTVYFEQTALRLSEDGKEIETSRGARVPTSVAPWLWTMACQCRSTNVETTFGTALSVGPYNLDKVDNDGSLHIGCHHIPFDELVLIAKQLNYKEYSDELCGNPVSDSGGGSDEEGAGAAPVTTADVAGCPG